MALETNLRKIQALLGVLSEDRSGEKDFVDNFKKVLDVVVQIQKQQGEAVKKLEETYNLLFGKLQSNHETSLADLKKQVDSLFVGKQLDKMTQEHTSTLKSIIKKVDDKLRIVDSRVNKIKDGERGYRGDMGPRGIQGPPPSPDMILHAVGPIFEKFEAEWRERAQNVMSSRVIAGPSADAVRWADLSNQGGGQSFTVPQHRTPHILIASQAPFVYRPTTDFTVSNRTLTLTAQVEAINPGQTVMFAYTK